MTPPLRSKLTVLALFALVGGALIVISLYRDQRGSLDSLEKLRCDAIDKALLQLDTAIIPVTHEQACRTLRSLAAMEPVGEDSDAREWRERGSLLVAAGREVWQVALLSPAGGSTIDLCSLRRRRGAGWSVIGEYPAGPVLAALGLRRSGHVNMRQ
jgi:hypothetical protein